MDSETILEGSREFALENGGRKRPVSRVKGSKKEQRQAPLKWDGTAGKRPRSQRHLFIF